MSAKDAPNKDTLYVYIPLGMKKKLMHLAVEREVSLSTLVAEILIDVLKHED